MSINQQHQSQSTQSCFVTHIDYLSLGALIDALYQINHDVVNEGS